MAGTFIIGEKKVRPGDYFNVQADRGASEADTVNGVTAVIFRSDFGPLGKVLELTPADGYKDYYGDGLTTDAIQNAFEGGADTVLACRIGTGGSPGSITLKNTDNEDAVKIISAYSGDKELSVTIRAKLTDDTMKECIIYHGDSEFERVEFAAGTDGSEADALVAAFAGSGKFNAELAGESAGGKMEAVSQSAFKKGTNPETTVSDYSDAFALVEEYQFNTICVDTEDPDVHILLQKFINRIYGNGILSQAVVAEKSTTALSGRMAHAQAFNDEQVIYILNAHVLAQGKELDGYQTAARVAGMVGAYESNVSLTHKIINGVTGLLERLKPSDMTEAELKGCLVLSEGRQKQVWIDNAINTLIVLPENKDEGWKKIRRTKTRFELIRRASDIADSLIGVVDNDANGKATVLGQLDGLIDDMVAEGKLRSGAVKESTEYMADTDSAYFEFDIIDRDSMEHIYLIYRFRFSTNEEE